MDPGSTLRNEDFRRLLSTPAASRSGDTSSLGTGRTLGGGHGFTHKQAKTTEQQPQKPKKKSRYRPPTTKPKEPTETDQLYSESDARLHEIMNKYRDRAAERRKGQVDGQDIELRAKLAGGLQTFRDEDESTAADKREQEIRESKYLGGDLDHTHLVKGLDYSLLNKTRNEMKTKDVVIEEEDDIEQAFQNPVSKHALLNKVAPTRFTRSICRTLFEPLPLTKNELFHNRRMAYVVELEESENDVPVTLLRSTFESRNDKSEQNMNANNMLINKLSEVLSYLRSDGKRKRKEVVKEIASVVSSNKKTSNNIYDDIGEYVPNRDSKSSRSDHRNRDREDRDRNDRDRVDRDKRDYFDDSRRDRDSRRSDREDRRDDRDRDSRRNDRDRKDERRDRRSEPERKPAPKVEHNPFPQTSSVLGTLPPEEPKPKKSKLDQEDAYGELFPSSDMYYGGSDEEEDFSKMDMGNKKGPVKRFDFETEEDYEKYMSNREANPKAAFQFGVKANSGRRTRKNQAANMEKKLDREYEQITKIWDNKSTAPKY